MKYMFIINLVVLLLFTVGGCKKSTSPTETETPQAPAKQPEATKPAAAEPTQPAEPEKPAEPAPAAKAELEPIPLKLPKPMFVGTPENLSGVEKLEKPLGKPRPDFLAPKGVTNIALKKAVTWCEEDEPIMGTLDMITDGDCEASEGSVVELGPFEQWVQIDLEKTSDIYAIVFWHFHKTPRVYFDIVVQISDDPDFAVGVTTIYNNDLDNSLGLGAGNDSHYVETSEGRLVDAKGTQGRYVRLYSQANNQNDYSHYIEVQVFGK